MLYMSSTIGWSEMDIARYSECDRFGRTIFFLDSESVPSDDRISGIDISQGNYDNRGNNGYPSGMITDCMYLILVES